jgi:hypothetical protein
VCYDIRMATSDTKLGTKTAHIAQITAALPGLDDEQLATLAEVAAAWGQPVKMFKLTNAEKAAVARSFDDFAHGRTLTLDEADANSRAFVAKHGT